MTAKSDGKVSIIIPCYNAERWVVKAVESCLCQTWDNVEVVVVDDGSTDGSLRVLEGFGEAVTLEAGPNRGANHARNRGLELATGEYVKFLDADDLLEFGALATQIAGLSGSGADVCYGDWQHLKHEVTGAVRTFPVVTGGLKEDVRTSLLSRWWCPAFAYLYRRDFLLAHSCLWDENLRIAQDFDFILGVALRGAAFCYVPGLVGTYRHHGGERVSRRGTVSAVEANAIILARAESFLVQHGQMTDKLKQVICAYYLHLAKMAFGVDRTIFRNMIKQVERLAPSFRTGKRFYDVAVGLLGYEKTEWLLEQRRGIRNRLHAGKEYYE